MIPRKLFMAVIAGVALVMAAPVLSHEEDDEDEDSDDGDDDSDEDEDDDD